MQGNRTNTRRDALGLAVLAAGMVVIGGDAEAAPSRKATVEARPTREELARAARLYAGEFGGGMGVR